MTTDKSDAEITRALKAALRKRFLSCKFSVTRGGEYISWTDDGPTQVEVEDAIISTGLVEADDRYDKRYLRLRQNLIFFDRYNASERAAYQQRWADSRERDERMRRAATSAATVRSAALNANAPPSRAPSDPETDQKLHTAFEALRRRAEAETAATEELRRRPSWAPPLLIEGELFDLCVALELLYKENPPVARLWATFADPKKPGAVLRHKISNHELPGIACRGFQLHPGTTRQSSTNILFEAQRSEHGAWQFGPNWRLSSEGAGWQWQRLTQQRLSCEEDLKTADAHGDAHVRFCQERLQGVTRELEKLEAKQELAAYTHHKPHSRRLRSFELAKARVLEFAGAPDAQMQLAGRRTGTCFVCGKALDDPVSVERGIVPDCYAAKVNFIRSCAREARAAGQEPPIGIITLYSGMPREFVCEVISEQEAFL